MDDHPLNEAARAAGSAARLAKAIGVSQQALGNWRRRGVPIERCAEIERASGYVVTRRKLRPNDWHLIWPELVSAEHPAPTSGLKDAA